MSDVMMDNHQEEEEEKRYLSGADEGLSLVLDLSELLDLLIALLLQLGLLQHTVNVPLGETAVGLDLHCTSRKGGHD
jgi:hypothetical protein